MDPITRVTYRLTWFDHNWNEVEGMSMTLTEVAKVRQVVSDWCTKRGLVAAGAKGIVLSVADHPHLSIQINQEVFFGKD